MADSNIGALPQAAQLDDDSLLVAEQQGQAVKVTGAQFKEFGRQAVIDQVQGYVDQAQAAAEEAVGAVSAVTDMTVEAHPSQEAAVSKSTKDGKVHLSFGLPQGEQGIPGPEGPAGVRGPRGETGKGLDILGYYDSLEALSGAVTAPEVGDAYGVGTEPPYSIYVFDGVTLDWKDNGPLSGGGGDILPENVVTTPGGAEMAFSSGDGPHTVTFTFEEEDPLTADDIVYSDTQTVKEAMEDLFTSVSDGKALIASAITDKGVPTQQDAAFSEMAANIGQITTGGDTSDATATPGDILAPKTAYTATGKVTGIVPTLAAQTITPGTADKTIANGQYLAGTQTIKGDPNLTSSNIKKGVSIFGVEGAVEQNFLATLTVTADVGAVVTATHTSGAEVEALSTTGTVVLELPLEGTWTVTAVRGVAQYNTVTVNVTSQYTATLTAEVHIEYYSNAPDMSTAKLYMAAVTIGDYAIFAGGNKITMTNPNYSSGSSSVEQSSFDNLTSTIDRSEVYDSNLTKVTGIHALSQARAFISGTTIGNYAIFAGGRDAQYKYRNVDAYDEELTYVEPEQLCEGGYMIASAPIGTHAIFWKGQARNNRIDAYDENLTRTTLESDSLTGYTGRGCAEANGNYAVFLAATHAAAYDSALTKTIITGTKYTAVASAQAGNYVLSISGSYVEAYDMFLTLTQVESLASYKEGPGATTLNSFALIWGGRATIDISTKDTFMDIYDPFLVRTTLKKYTDTAEMSATTVNGFALFAGGYSYNEELSKPFNKHFDSSASVSAFRYV